MSEALKIHVLENDDGVDLVLHGAFDATGARALRDAGRALLERGNTKLTIDCARVLFISSSGVGSLLVLQELYEQQGGVACIRDPSPEVRSVIRLMDLERVFKIVSSVADSDGSGPADPVTSDPSPRS